MASPELAAFLAKNPTIVSYLQSDRPAFQAAGILNGSGAIIQDYSRADAETLVSELIAAFPDALAAWQMQMRAGLFQAGAWVVHPADKPLWESDPALWQFARDHKLFSMEG